MEGQEAIEEMVKTVKPKATWAIKGAEAWEIGVKPWENAGFQWISMKIDGEELGIYKSTRVGCKWIE